MNEEKVPPDSIRPPHLLEKLRQVEPSPVKKLNWKEILKELVILAVIVFGFVIPFRVYVAEPYLVDGRSMDPTFETGNYLIVDKISNAAKSPIRNSVVVFKFPKDPSKSFIKRIIGLPGETVIVKGEKVTIINKENPKGFALDQTYVVHKSIKDSELKLGDAEYFVMGDNRKDSYDSRYWGALDKKFILGKPFIQLLPLKNIRIIPGSIKI